MYELRTAISYLLPKKGQLSVSVVGLIAVFVIQAIAWLILVFFSTTEGLESRWSQKLSGVLGSMRIIPTTSYFDSPEAKIDAYSERSSFLSRRLSSKINASKSQYSDDSDPPLPIELRDWNRLHGQEESSISFVTKKLSEQSIPWRPYESMVCHLCLSHSSSENKGLGQYSCVIGVPSIPLNTLSVESEMTGSEMERLLQIAVKPTPAVSRIVKQMADSIKQIEIIVSTEFSPQVGEAFLSVGTRIAASLDVGEQGARLMLSLPSGKIVPYPIESDQWPFAVIKVILRSDPLVLANTSLNFVPGLGYPVILSKHMRTQGACLLDRGVFEFSSPGFGGVQNMTLPFYVAGFFDSGILPIGGKVVISSLQAVMAMQPGWENEGPISPSGIMIDLPVSKATHEMQKTIEGFVPKQQFAVLRYDQYEVTQDLYLQLDSEKTLFRLISIIIVAVACSNIFSMLFILAHDRRKEIAVLRALGSSKWSITAIFVFAGLGVGCFGSVLGSILAAITLNYLPELLAFIGQCQGHELLQQAFYGEIASQQLQLRPVMFTLLSISILSATAGGFAAVRACRMNVSEALKG